MAEVDAGIQARLTGHAGLSALVNSVYSTLAPPGTAEPFITWRVFDDEPNEHMGSSGTPTTASVQVTSFTSTKAEQIAITTQLKDALGRYRGTEGSVTVQESFFTGYNDRYDNDEQYFQRDHEFTIHYEE
tara:strand:- start:150 stop:539 length:390 start_codon:yes stop_codon:yes gene_type:complete